MPARKHREFSCGELQKQFNTYDFRKPCSLLQIYLSIPSWCLFKTLGLHRRTPSPPLYEVALYQYSISVNIKNKLVEVWKSNEKANWYKNLCFSKINTVVSISSSANNTPKKKSHSYELILCTRLAEVYLRVRQLFHLLVVTMFSAQSKRAVLPMQIDITHVHLANLSFSSFSYNFAVHKTDVSCLKQICERPFK